MKDIREIYNKFPKNFPLPMILDGATGTELIKHGIPQGVCTEKWVMENPGVMVSVQKGYVEAGSDGVMAPTFGGSVSHLKKYGLGDKVEEYNIGLVKIARMSGAKYIAGDVSPTGEIMEPFGDAKYDDIYNVFYEQIKALESAGVDFFEIETFMSLKEAKAAVNAAKAISDKPVFVTFTVNKTGRTMFGDTMEAALISMAELGVSAFGCNCSVGPEDMLEVLKKIAPMAASLGIPVIAKPNAGMPKKDENGKTYYDMTAEEFEKYIPALLENGVLVLGGCCGTDKSHIKAIKENIDKLSLNFEFKKIDTDKLICNNKTVIKVDGSGKTYSPDDDLTDIEDDYVIVALSSTEDAEKLLAAEYSILCPIAVTGDREACEYFKVRCAGKTLII